MERLRSIELRSPGPLTTVQDRGRPAWGHLGIARGGALDDEALRWANRLVGNDEGAAALEFWYAAPILVARGRVEIAVLGGQFLPLRTVLQDGELLALENRDGSPRGIIALSGGIDVPLVLGSRATHLSASFGGAGGRRLLRGDVFRLGPPPETPVPQDEIPRDLLGSLEPQLTIRVLSGPQEDRFDTAGLHRFYESRFQIRSVSNRIGFRLGSDGEAIVPRASAELPSEPTLIGSIQITHGGEPIVLLNEGPVTGGYPKIATVIRADLGRMVRCRDSQRIVFRKVDPAEAREASRALDARIEGRFGPA